MSNNVSATMDDGYNYSMWVEIYNASTSVTYNMNSYYFTDDLSRPQKWKPVLELVNPGQYLVLYFERHDRTRHASFKLSPEGGMLYLLDNNGVIVDRVQYPEQYRNVSYGRVQDGADDWVYFSEHTRGSSNNGKKWAARRCADPQFSVAGGFYSSAIQISFLTPENGETIYYTLDGSEPTINSNRYSANEKISINKTSNVRACTFSDEKLPANVVSATYFIGERDFDLPVVSLVTEEKNLTDNTIGIYVKGTNGTIWREGETEKYNWYQDWDRPANFEFFDVDKTNRVNQELDIAISGGWTRSMTVKSLKISPRKKFGDNRLRYNFFEATKPGLKLKDIQIRNSGNDFGYSMMRDAFMQSIVMHRMDLDYQAYEPAVCYINSNYKGIMNLRERTSKDFLYSNYGLDEEDFYLLDPADTYNYPFNQLTEYLQKNDVSNNLVYNNVKNMMDIDNFIDYFIAEIYYANTDWPHNNTKLWKKKTDGRWRWILFDTDFGFSLYGDNFQHNTLELAITATDKLNEYKRAPSSVVFEKLLSNTTFKNTFIDRFCLHLSSTFATSRVDHIMDSIASKIRSEFTYHKARYGGNLETNLSRMKTFSANRPQYMLNFINSKFLNNAAIHTVHITSNIGCAKYKFNSQEVLDNTISLKSFAGRDIRLEPVAPVGYKFKQWEIENTATRDMISYGSLWKYWDGNAIPAQNWYAEAYSDDAWKQGNARLGYNTDRYPDLSTIIGYGTDAQNKYMTAYFRKTFAIANLAAKNDFNLTVYVDDGAVVYVNGVEIGRYNMPVGNVTFNTAATTYNNGEYAEFKISKDLLKDGVNLIAVEIHQDKPSSSDLVFDLKLEYTSGSANDIYQESMYATTLAGDISLKAVFETAEVIDPNEFADIKINEIVASNSFVTDEYGEYDDYIELYNNGNDDVNIAGWYLSDTPSNLTLSQIPLSDSTKTLIPSKGRIIIWADEQPQQGVLHADFKLSKAGETITLARKNPYGEIIVMDEIDFPALANNKSYSRVPDGSGNWEIQTPTFNRSNSDITGLNDLPVLPDVFPTLVSTHFIVTAAQGKTLRLVDVSGKVLLQKECVSEYENIRVDSLQQGVYFVLIGNQSFKIVKTL